MRPARAERALQALEPSEVLVGLLQRHQVEARDDLGDVEDGHRGAALVSWDRDRLMAGKPGLVLNVSVGAPDVTERVVLELAVAVPVSIRAA